MQLLDCVEAATMLPACPRSWAAALPFSEDAVHRPQLWSRKLGLKFARAFSKHQIPAQLLILKLAHDAIQSIWILSIHIFWLDSMI